MFYCRIVALWDFRFFLFSKFSIDGQPASQLSLLDMRMILKNLTSHFIMRVTYANKHRNRVYNVHFIMEIYSGPVLPNANKGNKNAIFNRRRQPHIEYNGRRNTEYLWAFLLPLKVVAKKIVIKLKQQQQRQPFGFEQKKNRIKSIWCVYWKTLSTKQRTRYA